VRKAEQNELTIDFSQSLAATKTFHTLHCLTRKRHGVPPQPFSFFANIQCHVLAQNQGWVVLARRGQVTVAGAIFLHSGRSVIYKYGASDLKFQHLRANDLVIWAAIQKYAGEGFESLDFGRTSLHNQGLRHFKLGWGTQERRIDYVRFDLRKKRYVTVSEKRARMLGRLYRFLPGFLTKFTGVLLYKHIALLVFSLDWYQTSICA
jgi:lipid II:glycine glycyltransferase (peptidoglycan interpeptide bridge formation enzyme)